MLVAGPFRLQELLTQWELVVLLQRLTKSWPNFRKNKTRQVLVCCDEMKQNAATHDWAAVWRLMRKIAMTKFGPQLRRLDQFPPLPFVQDWVQRLRAAGPNGGCSAAALHTSDSQSPRAMEQFVASLHSAVPRRVSNSTPGQACAPHHLVACRFAKSCWLDGFHSRKP